MKMKHIVKVEGQTYERHGEGLRFKKTYHGTDLVKILLKVAKDHSYGQELEELEATQQLEFPTPAARSAAQVAEILEAIETQNADGCDFISLLTVDGQIKIEEDEVVEEETEEVE